MYSWASCNIFDDIHFLLDIYYFSSPFGRFPLYLPFYLIVVEFYTVQEMVQGYIILIYLSLLTLLPKSDILSRASNT